MFTSIFNLIFFLGKKCDEDCIFPLRRKIKMHKTSFSVGFIYMEKKCISLKRRILNVLCPESCFENVLFRPQTQVKCHFYGSLRAITVELI